MTFGEKLNYLRKNAGLTQEDISSRLGISPQAVSKWENDLSCPGIMLLPEIAKLYGITVDELLNSENFEQEEKNKNTVMEKETDKKAEVKKDDDKGDLFLKVKIHTHQGDNVNVKLPASLLKSIKGLLGSVKLNSDMTGGIDLSEIDFDMIFELVERGVIGDIVDMTTQTGDCVKVCVERENV